MSTKDTGGPAFPGVEFIRNPAFPSQPIQKGVPGMTLRDYFAAKALLAIMAPNPVTGQFAQVSDFPACATCAYEMADAMLKARTE